MLVAYLYDYFIFTSSPGTSNADCPSSPSYITLAGDGTTLKTLSLGTGGSCAYVFLAVSSILQRWTTSDWKVKDAAFVINRFQLKASLET